MDSFLNTACFSRIGYIIFPVASIHFHFALLQLHQTLENYSQIRTIFESYIGPLTPTCQFWIGLLLRCVLLIFLIFLRPDASVLSMVVIIILIIVFLYNTGSIYNHNTDISKYICYKSFPKFFQQLSFLSVLNISFLLNLVFLGIAFLYADFEETDKSDANKKMAVAYMLRL